MIYRNTGAPIPRGHYAIPKDALFVPTEWERKHLSYKVKEVGETLPPGETLFVIPTAPVATEPEWPLRMGPKLYLRLHPEGEWAERAHKVLAFRQEGDDGGDQND
jgi:hypothetical protein